MNSVQVSKTQFSSSLAGSALIVPPIRLTFTFSGTITGGAVTYTQAALVPEGYKYYSDGHYTLSGTPGYTPSTIWKRAPRSFYLLSEPTSPVPRIYLSKVNKQDRVEVTAFLTNVGAGTFTLSRTYQVFVDVYLLTSNISY